MSWRREERARGGALASVLAGALAFSTLLSWSQLTGRPSTFLMPIAVLCALVAATGWLLRLSRVPGWLVPVVQLLVVAAVLLHRWGGSAVYGGWLPTPASVDAAMETLRRAVQVSQEYAAPIPSRVAPGFAPLVVGIGAAVAVTVDLLACTLRRVPLAGLPLLAVLTVPAAILDGVPWRTFALAAMAFVLLLAADHGRRLSAWGRPIDEGPRRPALLRSSALLPAGARLGAIGVGLAVLVPLTLPVTDGLRFGGGGGRGGSDGPVRIDDPMVDLRRDLVRGDDVPLLWVKTDDPSPAYLRITVLDGFDGTSWFAESRQIPESNRADGSLPPPPGLLPSTPRRTYTSSVTIGNAFDSTWLPVPYPAQSVTAEGDWRYDVDTLDVVSAEGSLSSAGQKYSAVSLGVHPDRARLADAGPPPPAVAVPETQLPADTPAWVRDLARRVTAAGASDFERAVILQDWFRNKGGFTYSLETDRGNGTGDLEQFLGTGPGSRTGYCEQFSAAMALLARSLGIPARLAVGFLRPSRLVSDTWEYSSHDLHSWPELYFSGVGWLRFEPTPADRTGGSLPSYARGRLPDVPRGPDVSASALPKPPLPNTRPSATPPPEQAVPEASDSSTGRLSRLPEVLLMVLLVVVLLGASRLLRMLLRRRRLTGEADPAQVAESAWAEVRATALDVGLGWDDRGTLRCQAELLGTVLGGAAFSSAETLARLVERGRYSAAGLEPERAAESRRLGAEVVAALGERAGWRATWLPASLWRSRRRAPVGPATVSGVEREDVTV